MVNIQTKIDSALKWSSLAEIIAKIIVPISNIILARLLTPEAFGVIATVTMVISFAETFSDSGFQKYLVQHEFRDSTELKKSADVAFSSNLMFSIILWGIIVIFNDKISYMVGNGGFGNVIIVAGFSLPITSFSSIQSALFKRKFDFKILCYARVVSALVPLIITVPLAYLGMSYWSLVIGTNIGNMFTAVILTALSDWKPKFCFNKVIFVNMFSFSAWSLLESLGTWFSSYIGTFIVGNILSQYYLGLYKTTMTTINGIFAIITSSTVSVLFSSLSRLQNDREEYDRMYLEFINMVSIIIIPLGVGIYIYGSFVTNILLGEQWIETVSFVRIYGLMCCFTLVLGQYASEYFRGLGKPKANVVMTALHLVVLVPAIIISSKQGFIVLAYTRSLVKIEQIIAYWLILWFGFKFNPISLIKRIWRSLISAIIMGVIGIYLANLDENIMVQLFTIIICVIVYFIVYIFVLKGRVEIVNLVRIFIKREIQEK